MKDEGMNNLREMAVAAAEGRLPQEHQQMSNPEQPMSAEQNNVQVDTPVSRVGNPLFAKAEIRDGTMVGDTPVYTRPTTKYQQQDTPPAQTSQNPIPMDVGAEMLMRAATQPKPIPTGFGLDQSALSTPSIPGSDKGPTNSDLYNSIRFNEDGTFSEGQLALIGEHLKDIPFEERGAVATSIFNDVENELQMMITQAHLSVSDAQKAIYDQVVNRLTNSNEDYKKNHPEEATVVIDKSQNVNDLGLTKEEHAKLEKAKKVRLVLLEDMDLATLEFEHPPEEHVADYIKSIEGSLAKYSIPLPMLGDFITLKGAQIVQMASIVRYEDGKFHENVSTKASLIYDKLIGGAVLKKFNETGESKMSYLEFINKFPYDDIDMAIFGILCASSLEESSTTMTCQHCDHSWMYTYNIKNLLRLDDVPATIKERIEEILKNKSNDEVLRELYENKRKVRRYRSPFTNNVYDLSYPSIARALDILKRIDEKSNVETYYARMALYIQQINIYNGRTGKYVAVSADNPALVLDTLRTLSNEDMNLMVNKVQEDLLYHPEFMMEVECPSCHRISKIPLDIDNLIFLMAQDSMVEIE